MSSSDLPISVSSALGFINVLCHAQLGIRTQVIMLAWQVSKDSKHMFFQPVQLTCGGQQVQCTSTVREEELWNNGYGIFPLTGLPFSTQPLCSKSRALCLVGPAALRGGGHHLPLRNLSPPSCQLSNVSGF